MARRIIESILITIIVIGAIWAWTTGQERSRLQAEFDRLVQATGDLPISDPTKVHVVAIPTGEPLHFAWRIHTPANYALPYRSSAGVNGTGIPTANAQDFIARVRIREEDGRLQLYVLKNDGSSRSRLGNKSLAKLLHGRESRVVVEQFASDRLQSFDPAESVQLLRLTLPEELRTEDWSTLSEAEKTMREPVLLTFDIGPITPKPKPTPSIPGK